MIQRPFQRAIPLVQKTRRKETVRDDEPDLVGRDQLFWNRPSVDLTETIFNIGSDKRIAADLAYAKSERMLPPVIRMSVEESVFITTLMANQKAITIDASEYGTYLAFMRGMEQRGWIVLLPNRRVALSANFKRLTQTLKGYRGNEWFYNRVTIIVDDELKSVSHPPPPLHEE